MTVAGRGRDVDKPTGLTVTAPNVPAAAVAVALGVILDVLRIGRSART
jgi:hypothetical protein